MNKGLGWNHRRMTIGLGLCLLLILSALTVGCGKKPPVETDMMDTEDVSDWEAPPPPQPEPEVDEGAALAGPDYALMDPSEYGIEDVFFAFDVYELSDRAMSTLAANGRVMREHDDLIWLVEGHCDERGTVEYNMALGEKRAKAVRDYLISLGVPSRQLRITSYGEERPFSLGHDEFAWQQNRRAHFANP